MRLCVYEQLEVHRVVIHMMLVQIPKGKLGTSVLVEVEALCFSLELVS